MKIEIPSQHRVLGRYGADVQAMVHCEELSELIQAISKMRRVRNAEQDDAETLQHVRKLKDIGVNVIFEKEAIDTSSVKYQLLCWSERFEKQGNSGNDPGDNPVHSWKP